MEFVYCLSNEFRMHFRWVSWGKEAVLYNRLSGNTHQLQSPGGGILNFFESAPKDSLISASKLLSSLSGDCLTSPSEVEELLAVLCSIGLLKKLSIEDRRPLSSGTVSSACS